MRLGGVQILAGRIRNTAMTVRTRLSSVQTVVKKFHILRWKGQDVLTVTRSIETAHIRPLYAKIVEGVSQ